MNTHEVVVKVDGEPVMTVTSFGDDVNMRKLADADPSTVTVEVWRVEEKRTQLVPRAGDVPDDRVRLRRVTDAPQA